MYAFGTAKIAYKGGRYIFCLELIANRCDEFVRQSPVFSILLINRTFVFFLERILHVFPDFLKADDVFASFVQVRLAQLLFFRVHFDDLIQKTKQLLGDASLAWVLYRLDSNIDHILIDEAQDTSPLQWDVITSISDEITAGQGSRENKPRTLFVVGDKKQSIYSFQGADAEGLDRMSARLHKKLQGGQGLQQSQLLHSFRSSPAILNAVDHVFDDDEIKGLGSAIEHKAFHGGKPGRVDLWDLVPHGDDVEEPEWYDPSDRLTHTEPAGVLASILAVEIRRMIETETIIGKNGDPRPIAPRDIHILVQANGIALTDAHAMTRNHLLLRPFDDSQYSR